MVIYVISVLLTSWFWLDPGERWLMLITVSALELVRRGLRNEFYLPEVTLKHTNFQQRVGFIFAVLKQALVQILWILALSFVLATAFKIIHQLWE